MTSTSWIWSHPLFGDTRWFGLVFDSCKAETVLATVCNFTIQYPQYVQVNIYSDCTHSGSEASGPGIEVPLADFLCYSLKTTTQLWIQDTTSKKTREQSLEYLRSQTKRAELLWGRKRPPGQKCQNQSLTHVKETCSKLHRRPARKCDFPGPVETDCNWLCVIVLSQRCNILFVTSGAIHSWYSVLRVIDIMFIFIIVFILSDAPRNDKYMIFFAMNVLIARRRSRAASCTPI